MASALTPETQQSQVTSLVILSALTLMAGAGGMAVSFFFLASGNELDVIAGTAGFLAGAVLAGAGLVSLAVQSRTSQSSQGAIHVAGCLLGLLPPIASGLAWPVLFFGFYLLSIILFPLVALACVVWAWFASRSVAFHLSALFGWSNRFVLSLIVFIFQLVAIWQSWELFRDLLQLLEKMGYKTGWS